MQEWSRGGYEGQGKRPCRSLSDRGKRARPSKPRDKQLRSQQTSLLNSERTILEVRETSRRSNWSRHLKEEPPVASRVRQREAKALPRWEVSERET